MRILILTSEFPPFRGGIGTYVRELALAAHEAGNDVVVIAPDYGEDQSGLDQAFEFRIKRFKSGAATGAGIFGRIKEALAEGMGGEYDIIHAADWPFFIPLRLLSFVKRGPRYLLTVHGTEIREMRRPRRALLLKALGFWKTSWAEWIANSQYTLRLLLEAFPGAREGAVRAATLAVDRRWSMARIPRAKARRRYALSNDRIIVVSLGRVVARKGHAVIADALGLLNPQLLEHIEWWIVGPLQEADYEAVLRSKVASLSLPARFFGALPTAEVQGRLCAADLLCLPGYEDEAGKVEGFGLVFLEAAAYGVPSLATWSGGIPEAITDGVTGMLVPEKDPAALAEALARLCTDAELRVRLGHGAEKRASSWTWGDVAELTYSPNQ